MTYKHVQPGDPLEISAAWHNAVTDLITSAKVGGGGVRLGSWSPARILVRNTTGGGLARFDCVGLAGSPINPAANPQGFVDAFVLDATHPQAERAIAVLQQPLAANAVGWAVVIGATPVRVSMADASHKFARPVIGTAGAMVSGRSGPVRILAVDAGTGTKTALGLLDDQFAEECCPPYFEHDDCCGEPLIGPSPCGCSARCSCGPELGVPDQCCSHNLSVSQQCDGTIACVSATASTLPESCLPPGVFSVTTGFGWLAPHAQQQTRHPLAVYHDDDLRQNVIDRIMAGVAWWQMTGMVDVTIHAPCSLGPPRWFGQLCADVRSVLPPAGRCFGASPPAAPGSGPGSGGGSWPVPGDSDRTPYIWDTPWYPAPGGGDASLWSPRRALMPFAGPFGGLYERRSDPELAAEIEQIAAASASSGWWSLGTEAISLGTTPIHDWSPAPRSLYLLTNTLGSPVTITGLSIGQVDGQEVWIKNASTLDNIMLTWESSGSSAANRFNNAPAFGSDTLTPGARVCYRYSTAVSRWVKMV